MTQEEIWEKAAIYADSQYDEESAPSQWTKAFHKKFKELDESSRQVHVEMGTKTTDADFEQSIEKEAT